MRIRFFIASAGVALFSYVAVAADPITLKIPCDSPPWMTCAAMKTKLVDGAADANYPGGMKAMIREMLNDVYDMKVRLAKNLVGADSCTTFDNLNKPPLCPPLRIPENGCADESTTSHRVPAGASAACPAISLVGAASNDHPLFSLGKSEVGTRETSAVAGGLLLAVSNQGIQITSEVANNALTVAPASPCYARAQNLLGLIAAQNDVRLIERINACDPNGQTQACSAKEYFAGNLTALLSGYLQVARCRLSDESTRKFVAFTADAGSPSKSYVELLNDLFVQQCFYPNQGNPAAMRACYAQRSDAWIKARARAMFPAVAAACP